MTPHPFTWDKDTWEKDDLSVFSCVCGIPALAHDLMVALMEEEEEEEED